MFESASRYAPLAVKSHETRTAAGEARAIRHAERRLLPPGATGPQLAEHAGAEGERLDHVAAKYLGDPAQFWRIADANGAMQPEDLAGTPGRRISIHLA